MNFDLTWWIAFNVAIVVLLLLDIAFLHKPNEKMPSRKALGLSAMWIALALMFAGFLHLCKGPSESLEFLTGFVIEKSLSIDNLFVFLLIFQFFKVPEVYRYRILMWGILGALLIRLVFIIVGITLIQTVHWILYVFGVFLVITGVSLFKKQDRQIDFQKNLLITILKKWMPITSDWSSGKFFVKINSIVHATPLFVTLLVIESTDVIFALDSIPAVFAITLDPFIVYSCNALAILGLRPLFFVLQNLHSYFNLLHYGVCTVLIFVGLKMLLTPFFVIPTLVSLTIVTTIVLGSILLSYRAKRDYK